MPQGGIWPHLLGVVPDAYEGCLGQVPEQDHHHWNQVPSMIIFLLFQSLLELYTRTKNNAMHFLSQIRLTTSYLRGLAACTRGDNCCLCQRFPHIAERERETEWERLAFSRGLTHHYKNFILMLPSSFLNFYIYFSPLLSRWIFSS